MNGTSRKALILFVREPRLGEVKTRLARTLGDKSALKWYRRMLDQLKEVTRLVDADRWVFYDRDPEGNPRSFWPEDEFYLRVQTGGDLGERMLYAFRFIFDKKGYNQVILAGSDCPGMTKSMIKKGYKSLSQKDVVLGPSTDGGYYLIGLKRLIPAVFKDMPWSTKDVLDRTMKRLEEGNHSYALLPARTDIDTEEDLEQYADGFPDPRK